MSNRSKRGLLPRAGAWLLLLVLVPVAALAQQEPLDVTTMWFAREKPDRLPPLSLVEQDYPDAGIAGAKLAIEDNNTTGGFLGQHYGLEERSVAPDGDVEAAFQAALDAGERLFVVDLPADDLLKVAPLAEATGAFVVNATAEDDRLRTEACSPAVFHTAPSRAMRADALMQFLNWKRWNRLFLIQGSHEEDALLADAMRRAAMKFGLEIVEGRTFEDTGGARRTDSGHVQVQRQIPVFTQDAPEHDVVLIADEADAFGEYLPYNTWEARPVVGSVGLVPRNWSRVHEQWGGTQIQRRFEAAAGRAMNDADYNAWLAVRTIGEAVTRTGSNDPEELRRYIVGDAFELGGFKGQALTYRAWNQQLRQPILLVTPRMLVSVSPQEGFLHQTTFLDTLGFDRPESQCDLNG